MNEPIKKIRWTDVLVFIVIVGLGIMSVLLMH